MSLSSNLALLPSLEGMEPSTLQDDMESGYASASASSENGGLTDIYFTKPHLKFLNKQLNAMAPEDILKWCLATLPNMFQTTAFGLTGLVTLDMLSKLQGPGKGGVEMIFLDTLHHFQETLDLVDRIRARYPHVKLHVYTPEGVSTAQQFEAKYGRQLWETNDEYYDYVAKVEPAQRANVELNVQALLTGRRRSQGGKRGDLDIIEIDDGGIIKVNPLANWSFQQVKQYIDVHEVPYNVLLDRNYKSIGDWHSTQPVQAGQDERSGRWVGKDKTECGIHNKKSQYAQFLIEQEALRQQQQLRKAMEAVNVSV